MRNVTSKIANTPHVTPRLIGPGKLTGHPPYRVVRKNGTEDWLFIYTAGGRGRFLCRGEELVVSHGDAVLLPRGVRHDYGVAPGGPPWEILWAHFIPRPHWLEHLNWPGKPGAWRHVSLDESVVRSNVESALSEMVIRSIGPYQPNELFAMNALEKAFLWCNTVNPESQQGSIDRRVRKAMDFLCQNLGRKVSVAETSEHCGLSESRLAHLFSHQAGVSPIQYLEQRRFERARELLVLTSLSIAEIAYQTGFEEPAYFSRRFAMAEGVSPSEFRKQAER